MPQVSLYFDEKLSQQIKTNARRKKTSLSGYVSGILVRSIADEWPDAFLDTLGSLAGSKLKRPAQPDFALDASREVL